MSNLRGNVLVVEDDADCGQLVTQTLMTRGYGVRLVTSRDDALKAIHRYIYEYIILDYAMPGMSIEAFVEKCRAITSNLILVSAVVDPSMEAARLGIKTWLRKPYDTDRLIEIMGGLSSGIQKSPDPVE